MRTLILKDFWWKFASLVAASVIWWAVDKSLENGEGLSFSLPPEMYIRDFPNIPITVMTAADDARGFRVEPSVVNVTINATKEVSSKISAKDIDVFLDLTDIEEAEGLSQKIKVIPPSGVTEIYVTPSTVRVSRTNVDSAEGSTLQPPPRTIPDADDDVELPAPGILSEP